MGYANRILHFFVLALFFWFFLDNFISALRVEPLLEEPFNAAHVEMIPKVKTELNILNEILQTPELRGCSQYVRVIQALSFLQVTKSEWRCLCSLTFRVYGIAGFWLAVVSNLVAVHPSAQSS